MSRHTKYQFRLYVTGDSPNSTQAQSNLIALCMTHLADRYEIDVVDVLKDPMVALNDSILMTPTLVKLSPPPVRRIVGSLSQMQAVLDIILDIIGSQVERPQVYKLRIVMADIMTPKMNGIQLLERIIAGHPVVDVVMITDYGTL